MAPLYGLLAVFVIFTAAKGALILSYPRNSEKERRSWLELYIGLVWIFITISTIIILGGLNYV